MPKIRKLCLHLLSYAEKTVAFFPGHGVLTTVAILSGGGGARASSASMARRHWPLAHVFT